MSRLICLYLLISEKITDLNDGRSLGQEVKCRT